jgi:4-amino-4-deoxy-L-arabinose transferase-like glycosyltransferase
MLLPARSSEGSKVPLWIFAFLLPSLLLLSGLSTLPLLDRDEPRFAQATREMIQGGNYLVPYFNGSPRFDKPPGVYWLMIPWYFLLGPTEVAARLPSVLSSLLLLILVWRTARELFGEKAAWIATFGLGTSLQFEVHGRLAVADMPMVAAVALTHRCLLRLLSGAARPKGSDQLLLYGSLAVGFLFKGPVAWLVPIATLLLYRWALWRGPVPWRNLGFLWGIPLCLGLTALWSLPALWATHGAWAKVGLGEHVLARGLEPFNGRFYVPVFYLGSLWVSLYPWSAFLPWTALRSFRTPASQESLFLWAWFFSPIVLFSFYATELPHYILPGFPAFFLLLGPALREKISGRFPGLFFWFFSLAFSALGAALILLGIPLFPSHKELGCLLGGLGCWILALSLLAWLVYCSWWRWLWVPVALAALATWEVAAQLRVLSPAVLLRKDLAEHPCPCELVSYGFAEPSLVFYSARPWQFLEENPGSYPRTVGPLSNPAATCAGTLRMEREIPLLSVLLGALGPKPELPLQRQAKEKHAETQREIQGIDVARFSWVRLLWDCPQGKTNTR